MTINSNNFGFTVSTVPASSLTSNTVSFLVNSAASTGLIITVGGVDISRFVEVRSVSVVQVLTRRGDTATFDVYDSSLALSFSLLSTVVVSDALGNVMFSGPLTTAQRTIPGPNLVVWRMGAQDRVYYLSKTLVNKKYTAMSVDAIAKDLLASFPPGTPITTRNVQSNLPILAYISFPHVRLSDAFDKMVRFSSSLSTLMWDIDPTGDLHFFDANHVPAADVALVDTVPTAGQCGYSRETFQYTEDASQLANQITFRGATYLSTPPHVQTKIGNGAVTVFPFDYAPDLNTAAGGYLPTVTVNGVSQVVAVDNQTGFGGADVLISVDINGSTLAVFATAPPNASAIVITYVFDLPVIVRRKDQVSVTSFGIWEEYIVDDTVATSQSAVQRAGAMLSQFSRPLAFAQVDVGLSYRGSLGAGQQLSLTCTQIDVSRQMIVTDCNIVGIAGGRYQYKLKLAAFD